VTAEIVSVGTELLFGQIADTNAQHLGRLLPQLGISHMHRQTVGDNLGRVIEAIKLALSRSDIVFTIGGLGPTEDDLTREAIAAALEEDLVVDDRIVEKLRKLFALRNLPWVDSQAKQGSRPQCGKAVENPNGTAPGLICEKDGKVVIALPGPRGEFVPMVDGPVRDYLMKLGGGDVIHSHLLRICGLGESVVEERIRPVLESNNPTVAPYAHLGEVHLRITAHASTIDLAEAMIAPIEQRIREALGDAIFGSDEVTLEQAVVELLQKRDETVAVAESMTGGGLGERFTNVPGSGDVFIGGAITYDVELKKKLLGVDPDLLEDENRGPVSDECARQMALGVRTLVGSTYGVSVTGNAGPSSDKGDKPVGLTYIGVAGPNGVEVEEFHFRGQRDSIRRRAQQAALTALRRVALSRERQGS
jgi:nicotinamide-nucleotide amidase